ncbi:hypothetical protein [Flavobacterium sp. PL12]|uniref:hypothetical protein n=1 Tax=Flavobacterium sp. PL12 TaxID=3071718 RepID=UPI00319DB0C2
METSITIIGLALSFLIAIPIFYSIRSNSLNKSKINSIINQYSQPGNFKFEVIDTLNKKVLAFDEHNKGFILMDFNPKTESNSFINLNDVQSCKVNVTKDSTTDDTNQVDLEFQYKNSKKSESIPFYKIVNDQMGQLCLYEDHQLAKKWKSLIDNCITK